MKSYWSSHSLHESQRLRTTPHSGILLLGVAAVLLCWETGALAQENQVKFAIHIQAHSAKEFLVCTVASPSDTTLDPALPCTDYNADGPLQTPVDLYVVIARADSSGVSGASFGILYDDEPGSGVDVFSWTSCISGLEFLSDDPVWPASGSGARLTWLLPDDCQDQVIGEDGVHAVVGAFYVRAYSTGFFDITPNRTLDSGAELAIANCLGEEAQFDTTYWSYANQTSCAGFGAWGGCNVCVFGFCFIDPVEPSTWGQLKNRYR